MHDLALGVILGICLGICTSYPLLLFWEWVQLRRRGRKEIRRTCRSCDYVNRIETSLNDNGPHHCSMCQSVLK